MTKRIVRKLLIAAAVLVFGILMIAFGFAKVGTPSGVLATIPFAFAALLVIQAVVDAIRLRRRRRSPMEE